MCFEFGPVKVLYFGKELSTLGKKPFENIVERGDVGNQFFLIFPQCFLSFSNQISIYEPHFFCRLQNISIWTGLKLCRRVFKDLKT